MFKTPAFWYRDPETTSPPLLEKILAPASWLYRAGFEIHQRSSTAQTSEIPIVCIGNLNAGGTGKTPTALALMQMIKTYSLARNPFFLLRGYGGGQRGPLLVDPKIHDAWDTGDEALILAGKAPTIVSADRNLGAELALRKGADLILMDDGLQNPTIRKDIKIIVINGEMGFGNGRMIPAGPLREPLGRGLAGADAFILIGEDKRGVLSLLPRDKPVIQAYLINEPQQAPLPDKFYLAFAGLGYPEKFFTFLREDMGLNVVETVTFPDHYPYNSYDLETLRDKALRIGAELITTQKDYLRLPKHEGFTVHSVPVRMNFQDESGLAAFLQSRLS